MTDTDVAPQAHVVLVCGGRDFNNSKGLMATLDALHAERPITKIVEGGAKGADRMARTWAIATGVPYTTYHADWARYGRTAGPVRNQHMLDHAKPQLVLAFPGGRGTAHMVSIAHKAGVEIQTVIMDAGPQHG